MKKHSNETGEKIPVDRNCSTCNKKYCRYAYPSKDGKFKYDYKKLFDCRNHQYFCWNPKEIMKVYLLWCFDHGTPNLIGAYENWIDAERECNRLESESFHEETFWLHYGVTEQGVSPQNEKWREFT